MKSYLLLFVLLFSIKLSAQIDYKRKFDSLTVVHKVCDIERTLHDHRAHIEELKKERQELNARLSDIQKFKPFRSEAEKEEQLEEVNELIKENAIANTNAAVHLTALINQLVAANEAVKKLQNN